MAADCKGTHLLVHLCLEGGKSCANTQRYEHININCNWGMKGPIVLIFSSESDRIKINKCKMQINCRLFIIPFYIFFSSLFFISPVSSILFSIYPFLTPILFYPLCMPFSISSFYFSSYSIFSVVILNYLQYLSIYILSSFNIYISVDQILYSFIIYLNIFPLFFYDLLFLSSNSSLLLSVIHPCSSLLLFPSSHSIVYQSICPAAAAGDQ